jgi:hypothetical protein
MTARSKVLVCAAAILLFGGVPAGAVSNGEGDLVLTFEGGIKPSTLPRRSFAPVAVWVSGSVRSTSGQAERLPQMKRIEVAINRQGRLYDRGLPVCHARQIRKASEAEAKRACGGAIVGRGRVTVQARLANQRPFTVPAKLLAFNGPRRNGRKQILAEAFAKKPPGSFILSFSVSRRKGTFGTVLSMTVPAAARHWAYLTRFEMTLRRTYRYGGRRRSFITAACPAPRGFRSALFPFAKVSYGLSDGRIFEMSQSARCRVRG